MITTHPRLFRLICVLLILAALICAWLFPFPMHAAVNPQLRAQWDTATSATVTWYQTARGCLSVTHATSERVFISCYEKPGSYRIRFGHVGPLSGDQRPTAGDVYTIETSGQKYSAPLRGRSVYFPAFRG